MTNLAPVTPPATPPSLSPGARTGVRTILVITAALLLVAGLGALATVAVGVGGTRVIADSQPLPSNMRTLTVSTGAVPIAVRIRSDAEASEPRVEMRFVSAGNGGGQSMDITTGTDTRITLRGGTPDWLEWARAGQLTIVLPPQVGERLTVTTEQQLGVLDVEADLDSLIARSAGGAVILDGSARRIEAEVRQGTVVAEDPILVRDSFSANVIEGDINVDFRDVAPATIDATTSDGDVVLRLPGDGPFLVNAASESRRDASVVRVPETSDPDEAESVITARATGGDVVIEELRRGRGMR